MDAMRPTGACASSQPRLRAVSANNLPASTDHRGNHRGDVAHCDRAAARYIHGVRNAIRSRAI